VFSPAETEAHIALARKVYEGPATTDPDHWIWKHAGSPFGPSDVTWLSAASGEMVGRTLGSARPFRIDGEVIRGRTIMDFVVDPAFRRADQTIRLIRAGSRMDDCDLILHGSNEMSDALYRKLFRYPIVGALTAAAFPLRVRGLLGRVFKRPAAMLDVIVAPWRWLWRGIGAAASVVTGTRLQDDRPGDEEFDAMLDRFRENAGPHFERTREFIDWRFATGPLFNARLLTIRTRGRFRGYVAVRRVTVDGFEFEVIIDFAHDLGLGVLERLAVRLALIRQTARTSADALFVIANFENDTIRRMLGFPFAPIPDRFLKHPTPIFAHVQEDRENRLKALRRTFMTLADIDYL
jgi:hypothetical protein